MLLNKPQLTSVESATDNLEASSSDDIVITVTEASTAWLTTGNKVDSILHFIVTTNNQPLIFKTNGGKQARITTTGVFEFKKPGVTKGILADYAYDSSYQLLSLNEMKQANNIGRHNINE